MTLTIFNLAKSFHRSSCLLYVILLLLLRASSIVAISNVQLPDEHRPLNEDNTSGNRETFERSAGIQAHHNSPALNHFLEDVLDAQDELKWIDRAVRTSGNSQNIETTFSRRYLEKNRDRKIRQESKSSENSNRKSKKIYLDDEEIKSKREIDEKLPSASLDSLKRTILELSDSLNPHDVENRSAHVANDDERVFNGKRKLMSSLDVSSAVRVAIEYYDYEEDGESSDGMIKSPLERQVNTLRDGATYSPPLSPAKSQITKIDENLEEEEKRQRLKNPYPKQEFVSEVQETNITDNEKSSPASSNSLYASLILKRMPADSESSDFYSQCEVDSSGRNIDISKNRDNSILREKSAIFEETNTGFENDENEFSDQRMYLVISPSVDKQTRKRSLDYLVHNDNNGNQEEEKDDGSSSTPNADKSAKNYAALKITDDMFKGGIEQSNPLGEDKPIIESKSFSLAPSASSSYLINSPVSSRSFKIKTVSPEWKVIEVMEKKKSQPRNSIDRRFNRRLMTQINEIPHDNHTNISSTIFSPTTNRYGLYNTTSTWQQSNLTEDSSSSNPATLKPLDDTLEPDNITHENPTTIDRQEIISETTRLWNNTRLRRHVDSFERDNIPKQRRKKIHRRHDKNREKITGRKRRVDVDDQQRKLTVLLAADNIDDDSQIDLAVHGELAGKIVERIFEQVQRNEGLKVAFGPGLYRKHKPQESMALDKMYRQGLDENEVKETETMMRRVMELLGRLVLDEVRRKTCTSLAPEMRDFLQWSLGLEEIEEPLSDQVPPLPFIPENRQHLTSDRPDDKFLFPNSSSDESGKSQELSELERKVALLKSLIKEYHALTEREKTKVQTVHDYLVRQLSLLLKYIESKEAADRQRTSTNIGNVGVKFAPQQILQYQGSVPSLNLEKTSQKLLNSSDNVATNKIDRHAYFSRNDGSMNLAPYVHHNSHESLNNLSKGRRKRGNRRWEMNDQRSNDKTGGSIEYKKLLHEILRRKKRNNAWGYEKPKIYLAPGESNVSPSKNRSSDNSYANDEKITSNDPPSHSHSSNSTSPPVRGKNRLEDEILLLNKREAWKKENQLMLEEVAFGHDTRNDLIGDKKVDESWSNRESEVREKRAYDDKGSSTVLPTIGTRNDGDKTLNDDDRDEINSRSYENNINVFPIELEDRKVTSDTLLESSSNDKF